MIELKNEDYLSTIFLSESKDTKNIKIYAGLRLDGFFFVLDFINVFEDGSWIASPVFETKEPFLSTLKSDLKKQQKFDFILQSILSHYLVFVKSEGDDANKQKDTD